jgi:hypothetical protein
MDMTRASAATVLRNAETEIARLSTQAATERDYDTAEMLLGIARDLAAKSVRLDDSAPQAAPGMPPASGDPGDGDDDAPAFEREGDNLVKTGKSRAGQTYEHKAPRSSVDALLAAISAKLTKSGEFRTSRILPLMDTDGRKLPVYQGYLALRWLRQIGLVHRVGRERYQMVPQKDAVTYVESSWRSLHQR